MISLAIYQQIEDQGSRAKNKKLSLIRSGKGSEIPMQESIDFFIFLVNLQFQGLNDFDVLVTACENASKRSNEEI